MDKVYLNAAAAHAIAEMSLALKNHVYKAIKAEASDNRDMLEWNIENCNQTAVDALISDLRDDGYNVTISDDTILVITW